MHIDNIEDVARIIFSPKMIYNGKLLPAAFELRGQILEDYLSVLRTSIPTWKSEMQMIPNRKIERLLAMSCSMSVKQETFLTKKQFMTYAIKTARK